MPVFYAGIFYCHKTLVSFLRFKRYTLILKHAIMKNYRKSEKVNTGSMADIAFLLLIFFLVTTTISTDAGIKRELPKPCAKPDDCVKTIVENNILLIQLNSNSEILIKETLVDINQLKQQIIEFVDNNGDASCTYCKGTKSSEASDNPKKAVIAIEHNRQTPYDVFISIHDEITKAIMQLRDAYSLDQYNKLYSELNPSEMALAQKAYPINISEIIK